MSGNSQLPSQIHLPRQSHRLPHINRRNRIRSWGLRIFPFWIFGLLFMIYIHWILPPMEGPIISPILYDDNLIKTNNNNNNNPKEEEAVVHHHNDIIGEKNVMNPQGYQHVRSMNILAERERISESLLIAQQNQKQQQQQKQKETSNSDRALESSTNEEKKVSDVEEEKGKKRSSSSTIRTSPLIVFFMVWLFCRICKFWVTSRLEVILDGGDYGPLRRYRLQSHSMAVSTLVDRLNAQRAANGERPISIESLRLALTHRDFDGNDYDTLWRFEEEMMSHNNSVFLGATDREIQRCPERIIKHTRDDLLCHTINKSNNMSSQRTTCAICLESYKVNDRVRTIPCFHSFHSSCIDPWLRYKAECPVCKQSAIT